MSTESATIIELRRLRPVKWSTIDKKTGSFRDSFVKTFLAYEGAELLEEDGTPMLDAQGRRRTISMASFSARYGINRSTFQGWVYEVRGYAPVHQPRPETAWTPDESPSSRVRTGRGYDRRGTTTPTIDAVVSLERHGQCSHCPEWKEA